MSHPSESQKEMPGWQKDRAIILHKACALIQERVFQGESVRKAALKILKSLKGETLGDDKKPLQISYKTLARLYPVWLKTPCPDAFLIHFKPGKEPVDKAFTREFTRRILKGNTINKAYESLVSDWKSAKPIYGIGTWRTWVQKHDSKNIGSPVTPPFPACKKTLRDKIPIESIRALQFMRVQIRQSERTLRYSKTAVRKMERQIIEQLEEKNHE